MLDLCDKRNWIIYQKIDIGWSADEKFYLENDLGQKFILRKSDIKSKERFAKEFAYINDLYSIGIKTHKPIEIGECSSKDCCFQLLEYIEGDQAERVLPKLDEHTQYAIGLQIGRQLKNMHDAFPVSDFDWEEAYNKKIDVYIKRYEECEVKDSLVDEFIAFVNQHRYLLKGKSTCQNHGDFHVGNVIITPENDAYIIDYNRMGIAEPWYEFNRIFFSFRVSPAFAKGQIEGYFNNKVPEEFFLYMKFYILSIIIPNLPWSVRFGEEEIAFAKKMIRIVYDTYDGLTSLRPKWYDALGEM